MLITILLNKLGFLIFGSIPILISGFGQYLFNWYGPLDFFNGLIIWYQRENTTAMTSLFNNPNYAGSWLNVIWPFCIAALLDKTKNNKLIKLKNDLISI